jgi:hypothetical protein
MRFLVFAFLSGGILITALVTKSERRWGTGPKVVYARTTDEGIDICIQYLPSKHPRVLYTARNLPQARHSLPDSFGFIPSPSGEYLLVWDTRFDSRTGLPAASRWLIVGMLDASTTKLGETNGEPCLLPYWADDRHVLFEGEGEEVGIFDVEGRKALQPLPQLGVPADTEAGQERARVRLIQYSQRHYPEMMGGILSALTKLEKCLGLRDHFRQFSEPPEYMFLRSLGIPGLHELRPKIMGGAVWLRLPSVICSPDTKLLACADVWKGSLSQTPSAGARIEVFKVTSGSKIWSTKVPSKPRPIFSPRAEGMINPTPLPWTSPEFRDIRWSRDGHYFSFTTYDDPAPSVTVLETTTWKEVLHIPNAMNAFVISPANCGD